MASYTVMPRFVVDGGALRLVQGPYDPPTAIYADNRSAPSPRLLDHLRRYDRFYVPWMYEPLPAPSRTPCSPGSCSRVGTTC
jgi:hypothetical protein